MFTDETNYLAHYGVKGMRWGVRKERPSSGRRFSKALGALDKTGRVVRGGASKVGGGLKRAGGAARSAMKSGVDQAASKVHDIKRKKQQEDFISAVSSGDVATVKKFIDKGIANEEDVRIALDNINFEKALMSEVSANRKKVGLEKVTAAMNEMGNSQFGRSMRKGAAEGVNKLTETVVKGLGSDTADAASKAIGAGMSGVLINLAMNKAGVKSDAGALDYAEAFKRGARESLKKSAKEKMGLKFDNPEPGTAESVTITGKKSGPSSSSPIASAYLNRVDAKRPEQQKIHPDDANRYGDWAAERRAAFQQTDSKYDTKQTGNSTSNKTSYWDTPQTRSVVDSALRSVSSKTVSGRDVDIDTDRAAKAVLGAFMKVGQANYAAAEKIVGKSVYDAIEAKQRREDPKYDELMRGVDEWKKRHGRA